MFKHKHIMYKDCEILSHIIMCSFFLTLYVEGCNGTLLLFFLFFHSTVAFLIMFLFCCCYENCILYVLEIFKFIQIISSLGRSIR